MVIYVKNTDRIATARSSSVLSRPRPTTEKQNEMNQHFDVVLASLSLVIHPANRLGCHIAVKATETASSRRSSHLRHEIENVGLPYFSALGCRKTDLLLLSANSGGELSSFRSAGSPSGNAMKAMAPGGDVSG